MQTQRRLHVGLEEDIPAEDITAEDGAVADVARKMQPQAGFEEDIPVEDITAGDGAVAAGVK